MLHRDTLLALAFIIIVSACASSPAPATASGQAEFHGARIGDDTLRSRLDSEG